MQKWRTIEDFDWKIHGQSTASGYPFSKLEVAWWSSSEILENNQTFTEICKMM